MVDIRKRRETPKDASRGGENKKHKKDFERQSKENSKSITNYYYCLLMFLLKLRET